MNRINKLKEEIAEIEASIPAEATKEELYDLLVTAYFKAKDIIELYDEKNISTTEKDLVDTRVSVTVLQKRLSDIQDILRP